MIGLGYRGLALAAALGGLAGCAEQAAAPVSGTRIYYADLQGGSQLCTVPKTVALTAGQQTDATMVMSNDGGHCGITVAQAGPKPFDAGLLVGRPAHGRVNVLKVGDTTRIDYTPDAAFGGTDQFMVRLQPGNPALKVFVTVQYTPPPAPPTPPPAPARTPARRK